MTTRTPKKLTSDDHLNEEATGPGATTGLGTKRRAAESVEVTSKKIAKTSDTYDSSHDVPVANTENIPESLEQLIGMYPTLEGKEQFAEIVLEALKKLKKDDDDPAVVFIFGSKAHIHHAAQAAGCPFPAGLTQNQSVDNMYNWICTLTPVLPSGLAPALETRRHGVCFNFTSPQFGQFGVDLGMAISNWHPNYNAAANGSLGMLLSFPGGVPIHTNLFLG